MRLSEKFLIKTLDIVKKTDVFTWYRFYRQTFNWDRNQVLSYQRRRLKNLLVHAEETVPFYKKRFADTGFNPESVTSLQDIEIIPPLIRDDFRNASNELLSHKYIQKNLIKGSSSGTTGIPIDYYNDSSGISAGIAAGYILWSMSGWRMGQKSIHIWGNQKSIKQWKKPGSRIKNSLIRQFNIASTLMDNEIELKRITAQIQRFKPVSIDGYTSSIYVLADYCQKNGIRYPTLKQVLTTAENLDSKQKERIEDNLAPTSDLYGSGELLGIACKPIGENRYYILDPHVIVEVADSGIKGMKDLLLTDLDNYAMPLIRYRIGDMTDEIQEPESGARYPFMWFRKIHGRSSDIIELPNGMKFHPVNIFGGTLFREYPEITKHKTIWDGVELKFLFETDGFSHNDRLLSRINELLKDYNVKFSVETTKKIQPSSDGKYKYLEIVKNV